MSGQFRFLQCIYKSIPAGVHSSWRKWQILFNMMIEKSEGTNKKFSKVGNKGLYVFGMKCLIPPIWKATYYCL